MQTTLVSRQIRPALRKTMRAAVLVAPRHFEIRTVPLPSVSNSEMLIRVRGCGICASNIPPFEGRPWFHYPMEPGALGHEAWGTIESVGNDVTDFASGDSVALLTQHAFAEFDVADVKSVVKLPTAPADEPFPAEPLACALNVFKRSAVTSGDIVAIVGIGFLGALLIPLARAAGARVLAISRRAFALDLARRLGADETMATSDGVDPLERVREFTENKLCDVVIEAVGKQAPLDLAAKITRVRGRLVIAGYHQDGVRQVNMQLWNWRGIDVINAHERDPQIYLTGIRDAIRAVKAKTLNPFPLYTHRFPLSAINTAFEQALARPPGFMKALVMME
jgi:threonine dehydrogenase-like Zn-dependent dehydrogenase